MLSHSMHTSVEFIKRLPSKTLFHISIMNCFGQFNRLLLALKSTLMLPLMASLQVTILWIFLAIYLYVWLTAWLPSQHILENSRYIERKKLIWNWSNHRNPKFYLDRYLRLALTLKQKWFRSITIKKGYQNINTIIKLELLWAQAGKL